MKLLRTAAPLVIPRLPLALACATFISLLSPFVAAQPAALSAATLPEPAKAAPAAAPAAPAKAVAPAAKPAPVNKPAAAYPTPQDAVDALVAALRANDARKLAVVLGSGHQRIIDSGDSKSDRAEWARYVASYDEKHSLQMDGDTKAILSTGPDDWPNPIPLVKGKAGWYFDANAGENEIVARRIGRNELDAIQVCLAFIDMQREYAEQDHNGDGTLEYSRRFFSTPGKQDGLYWPTKAGEPPSPGGPKLADASQQIVKGTPQPYHGYFYRIVTAQGKAAPGGARNYIVNGKLIGGVALVARPARYLASGVKTFTCNTDGIVYEKDLGANTAELAAKITTYDPNASWTKIN